MNPLLLPLLLAISIPAFADTYTGTVSEVKRLHNGGIAVDLDGKYPREKKILYVPADDVAAVGTIPTPDTKVTATGSTFPYKGVPEIKIHKPNQRSWEAKG
jgi:hypothetical protein